MSGVGPILRMSDDIDGIVAAMRDDNPGQEIRVIDRHAYVRIEGDPPLRLTRKSIETHVGREFEMREIQLMMSSFSGKIDSSTSEELVWTRRTPTGPATESADEV
jgi:toluene monooxygenase system protein D